MGYNIKDTFQDAKNFIIEQLDQNGNGEIDIADIIALAIKVPGVHVNRESFLRNEFFKNHSKETIDRAIAFTPAIAGISANEVDKIADEVIKFERNCVSGVSAALGMPGGWMMVATIPADIVQYYAYTLRAVQKLLYLYGFPEIDSTEDGLQLDTETLNTIILCIGVMNGVAGANNAIKGFAKALAVGVEKKLLNAALTKGAVFPFIRGVMKWFGINLTKSLFAGAVKKSIPVVGGFIGGGITFISFKPCCLRLKNALQDTLLANPNHESSKNENEIYNNIAAGKIYDVEYKDINTSTEDTDDTDDTDSTDDTDTVGSST